MVSDFRDSYRIYQVCELVRKSAHVDSRQLIEFLGLRHGPSPPPTYAHLSDGVLMEISRYVSLLLQRFANTLLFRATP